MTLVKKLRDAAMECSNVEYRALLKASADDVEVAIRGVVVQPDDDCLRDLIGSWAVAHKVLKNIPPEGDPAPLSGSVEPARLAA